MTNTYWPVYKNLEKEVIKLSDQIHFDDKQLSIYSVKITELILRCSIEIESISKDLYFSLGGIEPSNNDLYFDTDCIQLLEDKWLISKKQVIVSASNFHFLEKENQILTPLYKANKRGSSGSDWKKAYQAVKHNRASNLSKGNLKNLIRAIAALFILNIYYKDETFNLGSGYIRKEFSERCNSDIFSVRVISHDGYKKGGGYKMKPEYIEAVYIKIFSNRAEEEFKKDDEWRDNEINSRILSLHSPTKENIDAITNQLMSTKSPVHLSWEESTVLNKNQFNL